MNHTQLEFQRANGGASQCERILAALERARGEWVAMTDLWRASGAFAVHSRIADLRKRGACIEHKNERQADGTIFSFYRMVQEGQPRSSAALPAEVAA